MRITDVVELVTGGKRRERMLAVAVLAAITATLVPALGAVSTASPARAARSRSVVHAGFRRQGRVHGHAGRTVSRPGTGGSTGSGDQRHPFRRPAGRSADQQRRSAARTGAAPAANGGRWSWAVYAHGHQGLWRPVRQRGYLPVLRRLRAS